MDEDGVLILAAGIFLFLLFSTGLTVWCILLLRQRSDRPLWQDAAGVTEVPVRGLKRTLGFFGHSSNGIGARLAIAPDGLRFKVFRPDYWPFADIAQVDALGLFFVTRLAIRHRQGTRLYVDLADAARARDLLRALPATVPLTRGAAALRDGTA
ncbi:hypothetical protein VQH23_03490 [Pararoseomonas sp. SCSIO 73927]|uniref:hypothetical protein n=1 Tax=Pararoseomonas sp. SCSIO 73927 TaxID=3114537 RepID=UPI0030D18C0F